MSDVLSLLRKKAAAGKKQLILLNDANPREVEKAVAALASEMGRRVQPVSLAGIGSRYQDQTEKSLQAILEKAASSGAILLVEDSDALFGKRTGVKDAHDAYANQEIRYLAKQIEAYDGLVVVVVKSDDAKQTSLFRK